MKPLQQPPFCFSLYHTVAGNIPQASAQQQQIVPTRCKLYSWLAHVVRLILLNTSLARQFENQITGKGIDTKQHIQDLVVAAIPIYRWLT